MFMKNNYPTTIIILSLSLLLMNFRCHKGEELDIKPTEQTFEVPVDIFPLKKTYSLNDTLWIETDLQSKYLFDIKSNQSMFADTAQITFGASFNLFGTDVTSPPSGFCDVITQNGVSINRQLSYWSTGGTIEAYGCGQSGYKCRIGYKPNIKGTYALSLIQTLPLQSCPNKIEPYYASISFKYKNVDLGVDVFNSLSQNDKGGKDGTKFYTDKINKREIFVFRVE
jgi:hypothetical protein